MLSTDQFMQQQALLGSGYAGLFQVETFLESGLTLIAALDDVVATVDLTEPYATNLDSMSVTRSAGNLRLAAQALQTHIEHTSGLLLNEYLYSNGLKVTQEYAALSQILGVTINVLNIE